MDKKKLYSKYFQYPHELTKFVNKNTEKINVESIAQGGRFVNDGEGHYLFFWSNDKNLAK